ncbi:MAG TPA: DHHA1 domain-containing protein, partial [Pyrinomonadaceae bacterium]|nr:DHHA1 domain-containing protein [Pyrinomonadaceae bacterium]
ARAVVELFEAPDLEEARRLAAHLDARNRERQSVQSLITARALHEFEEGGECDAPVAVIAGDGWHRGVIGLAASKIADLLHRPCVVISVDENGLGHGSARSTEDFHLLDALTACADLFEGFGGHAHAAGLGIRRENIPELRRRLSRLAAGRTAEAAIPTLHLDAELPSEALTLELCDALSRLEPFGAGWPRPVFLTRGLRVVGDVRVVKERHLKIRVAGADGRTHDALWWGGVASCAATPRPGQRIELAHSLETNTWRGETNLQLVVEDMKSE